MRRIFLAVVVAAFTVGALLITSTAIASKVPTPSILPTTTHQGTGSSVATRPGSAPSARSKGSDTSSPRLAARQLTEDLKAALAGAGPTLLTPIELADGQVTLAPALSTDRSAITREQLLASLKSGGFGLERFAGTAPQLRLARVTYGAVGWVNKLAWTAISIAALDQPGPIGPANVERPATVTANVVSVLDGDTGQLVFNIETNAA